MSDDLVKRLRAEENSDWATHPVGLLTEAANRIEQLEAALKELGCNCVDGAVEGIRDALEGKDG